MKKIGKNLLLVLTLTYIAQTKSIYSSNAQNNINLSVINNDVLKEKVPKYKLGPGDKISIKIFQTQDFNSIITVLPDGTINLPRVGLLKVWGLNIEQTQKVIEEKYKRILRNPIIYVDLVSTRDVRVLISGEVQRPGIYSIGLNSSNTLANTDGGESSVVTSEGWPTVIEAIQKAGGITSNGDIRNIELRRSNNSEVPLILNYWDSLSKGINFINPYIYDGDTIRVKKAKSRTEDESLSISGSSFAPSSITVNVIGEVKQPGLKKIRSNSPLNLAIFSAGGLNEYSNRKEIRLIRLKNDGTTFLKKYKYTPAAGISQKINPALKDGDVIVVPKNLLAQTSTTLQFVVEPVRPIINAASLYKILNSD